MTVNLVAQGQNIEDLVKAENLFEEGEVGEVRLYLSRQLNPIELTQLERRIGETGAVLAGPIQQTSTVLVIPFQKALPFLILLAPLVAGMGVLGWQLFKPEKIAGGLILVSGILILGLFLLGVTRA